MPEAPKTTVRLLLRYHKTDLEPNQGSNYLIENQIENIKREYL